MSPRSEQTLVGLFVLITAAILVVAVVAIHGQFSGATKSYHAHVPFAGGIEKNATVRYLGGPAVGRVDNVRVDPQDTSQLDMSFTVSSETPVKTDSKIKIMSLSPLGENHLEILSGSAVAGPALDGQLLAADTYIDFNVLAKQINDISPRAQQLLLTLNDRATELKVTIDRVNDLLSDQNRANLSGTLAEAHGMIADSRPQVRATLQHVDDLAVKLNPLIDDFRKTAAEANDLLSHVDAMVGENRPDVHMAVLQLRTALNSLNEMTGHLNQTLDVNSDNIDEMLENMVRVTENLREFTGTIRTRPNSLIFAKTPADHKPGDAVR